MDQSQIAGIAALYAVVELVKWLWTATKKSDTDRLIKDLHDWHSQTDDEGRKIWYVPKRLYVEQEKILDTLREISKNQETTATVLESLVDQLKSFNP